MGHCSQEVDMFARKVSMHLKDSVPEFTQTLEREVIPLLRKQKGFRDEITFVAPGGKEAFGISLWDQAENAESYNRGGPHRLHAKRTLINEFLGSYPP